MDVRYTSRRVFWEFSLFPDSWLVCSNSWIWIFREVPSDEKSWEEWNSRPRRRVSFYGQIQPSCLYFFLSQSRSIVSWPICLCASSRASSFSLMLSSFFRGSANTSLVLSMKSTFQLDSIVGWSEYLEAISASVAVLEITSSTTFVLNSEVYLFRVLFMGMLIREIWYFLLA